jgi:hypothetical protein
LQIVIKIADQAVKLTAGNLLDFFLSALTLAKAICMDFLAAAYSNHHIVVLFS